MEREKSPLQSKCHCARLDTVMPQKVTELVPRSWDAEGTGGHS